MTAAAARGKGTEAARYPRIRTSCLSPQRPPLRTFAHTYQSLPGSSQYASYRSPITRSSQF